MHTVTSQDGTKIAYDVRGQGPALILVGGAMQQRAGDAGTVELAERLAPHFTVYHYDRRGRGDSTDTLPYAVEREIEDIKALMGAAGGEAYLFGNSSGAVLAMLAAVAPGSHVTKLAMYEPPVNDDGAARLRWREYRRELSARLAAGRKSDAAALFMQLVGMPDDQIAGMRQAPFWAGFEAVAPTLAYDAEILGEESVVPVDLAARVTVPALVMNGGASYPFMAVAAAALALAMPNGRHHVLEGQTHAASMDVLAPVLDAFFMAETPVR